MAALAGSTLVRRQLLLDQHSDVLVLGQLDVVLVVANNGAVLLKLVQGHGCMDACGMRSWRWRPLATLCGSPSATLCDGPLVTLCG